jgi:hypothetical protein
VVEAFSGTVSLGAKGSHVIGQAKFIFVLPAWFLPARENYSAID